MNWSRTKKWISFIYSITTLSGRLPIRITMISLSSRESSTTSRWLARGIKIIKRNKRRIIKKPAIKRHFLLGVFQRTKISSLSLKY